MDPKKAAEKTYSWKSYEIFSSMFLENHHNTILYHVLHQIIAFLLFPFNCSCKTSCHCEEWREEVLLTLNVELYNKAKEAKADKDFIYDIRFLLRIPEDSYFRENCGKAYPLWLVKQDFEKFDKENYFRGIENFVWELLRFDGINKEGPFKKAYRVTKEKLIAKSLELKTNIIKFQKKDYLSEKESFEKHFNTYKSVCHFVAAYEFMKRERQQGWQFFLNQPDQIRRFLNIAFWFRSKLLSLKAPDAKEALLFSEDDLVPLSSWVQGDENDVPSEPYGNNVYKIGSGFLDAAKKESILQA